MRLESTLVETMRCNLMITNNARNGIQEWSNDEHAFFAMQESFHIHIEKRPENKHGNIPLSIYFDNETNTVLAEKLDGKVAVMECVLERDGLLATGFRLRGPKVPVRTNRRLSVRLKFVTTRNNGAGMPLQLHTSIREMPIAEERSEYVKKRISSWEGYLKIQERNADIEDISTSYSKIVFNEDFTRMTIAGCQLNANEWNKVRGLSVTLKGFQNDIGDVLKVDRNKKTIEIELKPRFQEMARRNQLHPKTKDAVFSNFATLSQIRRLRKGFEDLQNGLAANPNLEKILFENRPTTRVAKERKELEFHNQLNEFQKEAVVGAMSAEDLYVIQGPPGTGKTTVISEICQQNAKAGLRTLVASQSNLAVDNALGRLLSNQAIRILRFGRTESIEEEGKKFIEENVGQYWKDQTLHVMEQEIASHSTKAGQLEAEMASCDEQTELLQKQLISLEEKIKQKQEAQTEHAQITEEIKKLKKSLISLKKEKEELEKTKMPLESSFEELSKEITKMEQFIQSNLSIPELIEKITQIGLEIDQTKEQLAYQKSIEEVRIAEKTLLDTREEYKANQVKGKEILRFSQEIPSIIKLEELKKSLNQYGIIPDAMLERQIAELDVQIEKVKSLSQWQEVNNKLQSAIEYLKKNYQLSINNVEKSVSHAERNFQLSYSVEEIQQFIDRTRQLIISQNNDKETFEVCLVGLIIRKNLLSKQANNIQIMKFQTAQQFRTIKETLVEQVKKEIIQIQETMVLLQNKGITQKEHLNKLTEKSSQIQSQLSAVEHIQPLNELQANLKQQELTYHQLKKTEETLNQYVTQLESKGKEAQVMAEQMDSYVETLQEMEKESKRVNSEGLQQEKQLKALDDLINQTPEEDRERTLTELSSLSERKESLQREKERLPITHTLQNEWHSLLQEANEHDLDEIRKLYVRHANVIGTTCVASARKEFMENYPTFDVVIIDEVSKATPPELLLPMLKGKKIILVGDHHQLPPLVGEDTLDETLKAILEESDSLEEKDELKKLLKESLFERLFKNLPKTNKTMLAIQYRMHESIMETITPFYEEQNYRLQCGLVDSDAVRDHLLESRFVNRNDHLLWLDMPNEQPYFEERVKDGKSRFNQAELNAIREVLIDLDQATETAKREGRMKQEERKSIGVISFYGEQVKRIDRLIQQEMNLKHLTFRTGTVDKFQGMEMDVIILSMVRNNKDRNGDIGFANDYRRLNVALSRARELLMLVGSAEMFTQRAKRSDSRAMYSRLLGIVKEQKGFRDQNGDVKSE